ncbi:MFS transporter [Caulobacter sp. NIBR1757]|uniref:MFS transporter n=1 Tax=Caulobacter sp. NIBR1757 TaxID=3016000 RepID=UPI0022EFDBCA|nr:MFS transporter [Caulobacter sp. NIBR1757]WGM41110.1 Riboflavin transporter RibZ [Caulobacter sp. NIBR1757]
MSEALLSAPDKSLTGHRQAVAVFAVLSAMALVVLDAGIANLALPVLGETFGVAPAQAILVVTAYQAGLVMALLPAGALGERYGYRRVFAIGLGVFATASALSALAPSLPWLVAARLVQGLGGAAIMALGVALLRASVGSGRLGAAIGWNALTVALASAAAPSLGAIVLAVGGRPALFAAGLPLAAAALAATRALPTGPRKTARPDLAGMALNALAFGLLITSATVAPRAPDHAVLLFALGAGALATLVRRDMGRSDPLIPLDLLRGAAFRLSVVASVCCFAGQTAGLVALPFLLQHGLNQSPLMAGLYITAWPLSVAVSAVVAGRLADRVPSAGLCAVGGGCLSAGLAGAACWPLDGQPARLIPFIVLAGVGFGLFQTPNNRTHFLAAPPGRGGAAGGMQGSARVTGQTIGALAMSLLFALTAAQTAPAIGLGLAAGLALVAGLVSLLRGARASR